MLVTNQKSLVFRLYLSGAVVLLLTSQCWALADDPVFSGPQVGEKLPSLKVKGIFGDLAGKEMDLVKRADGKPTVLIFFHAKTRPAFGLTNTIMKYVASRSKDDIESSVVFLTDDATATEKWMHAVEKHFAKGVKHVISPDGLEGPGSYGLNRNVALTVLIGNKGKVTANFALVQPSLQADGPKILKAIVDVTGGGKVPAISDLGGRRNQARPRGKMRAVLNDPQLTSLLRAVINKQASAEDVKKAVATVEKYVSENKNARRQLGQIASRVVNSGKLSNYGTKPAQETLRRWAKTYGPAAKDKQDGAKRE